MNAIEQLKSVLCNHDGKCCIAGSEEDRAIVDRALQALAQPEYRAVKTYHEGKPVYVAQQETKEYVAGFNDGLVGASELRTLGEKIAQPEQPKYRRGSRVICLETEEYCVIHISGTDRQWVKFPDSHIGVYTNEQVAELFELLPKEQPQQEQNLNCKSVQARLATAWGYVKAQPQQEPVAWIHNFIEGGISIGSRPADLERHPDRWTALFKDQKPCPTCEALARTVMLDQTSHDAAPPQRTWVGLTKTAVGNHLRRHALGYQPTFRQGFREGVTFAETKLRSKNT